MTLQSVGFGRLRARVRGDELEWVAGAGLVARGAMHVVVAVIAFEISRGQGDNEADGPGALEALAKQPFGRVLVALMAFGFVGYAGWRLAMSIFDTQDAGRDVKGVVLRAGYAVQGLVYAGLAVPAFAIVFNGTSGSGSDTSQQAAAGVLGWPYGRWLVAGAGLVVCAVGMANAVRAFTGQYLQILDDAGRSRSALRVLGRVGLSARAVVFVLAGGFLIRAAWRFTPREGVGLDATLHELAQAPYGRWLLVGVAGGLAAHGAFLALASRYVDGGA